MSSNSLKKMMVFSSENTKRIVEAMIRDESIVKNCSMSALIEKHILDSILPQNKNAHYWITSMYSNKWSIGDVLYAAFGYNASGINWCSVWDNYLPLVLFAQRQQKCINSVPTGKEGELFHFRAQLDSFCKKFEELSEDATTPNSIYYLNVSKYARELLRIATYEPKKMKYIDYYKLVCENWDILKDWSITYRLLCDLATMETRWHNTPDTRYELTLILKDISKDWDNMT